MKTLKRLAKVAGLCFCSIALAAPQLITGAGASFPYPLYAKWFSDYRQVDPSVEINYQSIGSGGGIKQFMAKTTDFGASDVPMTDLEMGSQKAQILQIPTTLGAVAISYNLPNVDSSTPLRLTSEVLAEIFLGRIKMWDDPRIKALNPTLNFAAKAYIIVCHRSDGSGTTAVFTDYLASASPEWKTKVGIGKDVKFPTGLGGKGNEGVTGLLRQNPGAIGYLEMNYALTNKLAMARLKNGAGEFILPDIKSVSAAAAHVLNFRASLLNASGKGAYPMSSFTYLLVWKKMDRDKGQKIVGFLKWAIRAGQQESASVQYPPLPQNVVKQIEQMVASIELK